MVALLAFDTFVNVRIPIIKIPRSILWQWFTDPCEIKQFYLTTLFLVPLRCKLDLILTCPALFAVAIRFIY